MEANLKLFDAEYRFMDIVWQHEPLPSGELARLAAVALGWKRTTTYTVLKKLCTRGILQNTDSIVSAPVKREQVQRYESRALVEKSFGNSLPRFIAAFLDENKLTAAEAEELKAMIDRYKEG